MWIFLCFAEVKSQMEHLRRKRKAVETVFWGDCGDRRSNILLLSTFFLNCYCCYCQLFDFGSVGIFWFRALSYVSQFSMGPSLSWGVLKVGSRIPRRIPCRGEEALFTDPAFNGDVAIGSCDVQGWRKPFKWVRAKQLHKMLVAMTAG